MDGLPDEGRNGGDTVELKPCPFCNGEAFLRRLYTNYIIDAKHNENCPMSILPLPHDTHWVTREAARAAWNLRRYHKTETTKMGDEING